MFSCGRRQHFVSQKKGENKSEIHYSTRNSYFCLATHGRFPISSPHRSLYLLRAMINESGIFNRSTWFTTREGESFPLVPKGCNPVINSDVCLPGEKRRTSSVGQRLSMSHSNWTEKSFTCQPPQRNNSQTRNNAVTRRKREINQATAATLLGRLEKKADRTVSRAERNWWPWGTLPPPPHQNVILLLEGSLFFHSLFSSSFFGLVAWQDAGRKNQVRASGRNAAVNTHTHTHTDSLASS